MRSLRKPSSLIRFGAFELDTDRGSLSRSGQELSVRGLPLRILSMLIEADGRVVTRQHFKESLWPGYGRVDTERRLTTAVRALRQALEDSAESPRYVETVRGSGYRWCYVPRHFLSPRLAAAVAAVAAPSALILSLALVWNGSESNHIPYRSESIRLVLDSGQDPSVLSRELDRALNDSIGTGRNVTFRTRVRFAGEETGPANDESRNVD